MESFHCTKVKKGSLDYLNIILHLENKVILIIFYPKVPKQFFYGISVKKSELKKFFPAQEHFFGSREDVLVSEW